jgi:hypothetical protein
MALTETQKAQVRMYLGYERGYDLNYRLESKLDVFTAAEEALVGDLLTKLAALDARIDDATTDGTLDVAKVDEVEMREGDPLERYAAQGRRLVARLEILCAVEARADYYGQGAGAMGGLIALG